MYKKGSHSSLVLSLSMVLLLGPGGALAGEGTGNVQHLGPGNHKMALKVGQVERHYLLHVPRVRDEHKPLPVVIVLHGAGGTGQWTLRETGWADKADQAGFLVVLPEGTPPDPAKPARFVSNPQLWNDGSDRGVIGQRNVGDVGFIKALIEDLRSRLAVDPRRIYVTGFSNGAALTFRLGAELSSEIAAIAPVAGYCWLKDPKPQRPIPTLYLVGTADPLVPLEGGEVQTPWGAGGQRPPVKDTLVKWAKALGSPTEAKTVHDKDGVKVLVYGPGKDGVELTAYLIEGLGHHWPGGKGQLPERWAGKPSDKVKATDVIWEFFEKHPRSGH